METIYQPIWLEAVRQHSRMDSKKSFDIIGLAPDTVCTNSIDESKNVTAPPLASKRLLDLLRKRICGLHYSLKNKNN